MLIPRLYRSALGRLLIYWSVQQFLVFFIPAFGATFTVLNTSDSGVGSLRQAIMDANNNPGADLISFQIPGTKPYTISPLSPLPSLTDPVTIDGTTQTGFTSQPIIQLNGAG